VDLSQILKGRAQPQHNLLGEMQGERRAGIRTNKCWNPHSAASGVITVFSHLDATLHTFPCSPA